MGSIFTAGVVARPRDAVSRLLGFVCLALVVCSTYVSQHWWRDSGLRALEARNDARIDLVASALRSEINRQDHLPIVLSLDADVRELLQAARDEARMALLSEKLQTIRREADAGALYVVAGDGTVVAAAQPDSDAPAVLGQSFARRSYFLKAMESGRSSYLGVDPATNRVGYFLAEAIKYPAAIGAAVVRVDFDALETTWSHTRENVLVTDAEGVVFLASDPLYKYRKINSAKSKHLSTESAAATYPAGSGRPLDLAITEPRGDNAIVSLRSGEREESYFYTALPLPEYGWTIHRFTDLSVVDADQRDGAIIGAAISGLIVCLALYLVQRQRAYLAARDAGVKLQSQVEERTRELREANALLQTEVDERRRTEIRLRATQNELVQAGKLAALGQMSAAIAHEVNQPLAAMRTFMASAKVYLQRNDAKQVAKNIDLIDALAERMAKITSHLKSFARKSEPGRPEPIQVGRAIDGALFLTESQIKSAGVRLTRTVQADLWVSGYTVQLEQVLVNLLRNALDAVADTNQPAIEISASGSRDTVRIVVADNGPGIAPELVQQIFDPFVTSKPVGKGLGLGLSISYGIVQGFRGRMYAANPAQGGAELVIELPRLMPETALAEKTAHA